MEITGYPAYFDLCSFNEMNRLLLESGFRNVRIIPYYKAGDYFAFFTPLYIFVAIIENICEILNFKFFASGLIICAQKKL